MTTVMHCPPDRRRTGYARAKGAAITVMLIFVALLLAVFPFLPVQLLRKQREERQEQEISRDLDE